LQIFLGLLTDRGEETLGPSQGNHLRWERKKHFL
jgi:hypothetical protein